MIHGPYRNPEVTDMEKVAHSAACNIRPIHKHDCHDCRFLGALECRTGNLDLYACEKPDGTVEYVARHGSRPDEYGCGPSTVKGSPYSLAEKLWERRKANSQRWIKTHPRFWVAGPARPQS